MLRYFVLFLLVLFSFSSCISEKDDQLLGKWKAIKLLEQDSSLQLPLEDIWFQFKEQKHYYFHSTLNYEEAGQYELSGNLLYTTDTTSDLTERKAVKILELSEKILKIEMKDQGNQRILILEKE
ncbi:MAG: hypothetical protein AAF849_13485 [Bacteroidota bacterium]